MNMYLYSVPRFQECLLGLYPLTFEEWAERQMGLQWRQVIEAHPEYVEYASLEDEYGP